MKKSHIFPLRGVFAWLAFAALPFFSFGQNDQTVSYSLSPENVTTTDAEVSGSFEMNFIWSGDVSTMDGITWDNSAADEDNGSAYLYLKNASGEVLWSGYPEEISETQHNFPVAGVVLETNAEYTLEIDLSQVAVSIYSQSTFPWEPLTDGPIEIISTSMAGTIDHPFDPNIIFPVFNVNVGYGVGLNELDSEDLKLYPNPAEDYVTLPEMDMPYELTVYSLDGRVVLEETIEIGQSTLDISMLNAAVYLVQIAGENVDIRHERLIVK